LQGTQDLSPHSVGSVLQGESSLSFSNEQGAALILPSEARREDTFNMKRFKRHMIKHYREWYNFALDRCERDIKLQDLILVTGCDLTRQWTTETYFRNNREINAALKAEVDPVAKVKFSSSTTQPMNTRQGPPQASLFEQQSHQDNNEIQNDSENTTGQSMRFPPWFIRQGTVEGVLSNEDVTVESMLPSTQVSPCHSYS
jgi:hypothetical protein